MPRTKEPEVQNFPPEVVLLGFAYERLNGTFALAEDKVNGMPCYQNDGKWLFYNDDHAKWFIGSEDKKGSSSGYAKTEPGERSVPWLRDAAWIEYTDGAWHTREISHE